MPAAYKQLGFQSYSEYLSSDLWKEIRERVMYLDGRRRKCSCCGRKASQVHHKSYELEVMRGDRLCDLVPVCRRCHKRATFKTNGKRRPLKHANALLLKMTKHGGSGRVSRKRVMCPDCGVNRRLMGGPCPFCLKRLGMPDPRGHPQNSS